MKPDFLQSWKRVVPGITKVLSDVNQKTIIGFGMVPYPRIVPSLFLKNYIVYAVKDTADLDLLRKYSEFRIFCLEEKFPKAATKIHAASYLLGNYAFHAFLKSRPYPFYLLMHRTTLPIVQKLEQNGLEWIGNHPNTFEDVWLKADFQSFLKKMGLPALGTTRTSREDFLQYSFEKASQIWQPPFTVQRLFSETGLEQAPFVISDKYAWEDMIQALSLSQPFLEVQVSPVIQGLSLSTTGCITPLGVLSSALQLQLVNVKEVFAEQQGSNLLVGYDFGFCAWGSHIQTQAQKITETVGEYLSQKSYKGVFGINFLYDQRTDQLFGTECIPQFPEDMHIYSLGLLEQGKVPPLDFFHIATHLDALGKFDFEAVNAALKERVPLSHIFLAREGIQEMRLALRAGVYSFDLAQNALTFQREEAFPWELKSDQEFLMLDSMPRPGKPVIDNVPSIFKLIIPGSIGESSSQVKPHTGTLLSVLSKVLREQKGGGTVS